MCKRWVKKFRGIEIEKRKFHHGKNQILFEDVDIEKKRKILKKKLKILHWLQRS